MKELIAQILVATESDAVRDAAALALADLEAVDQMAALLSVLRREELVRRCGILLYALDERGGNRPVDIMVRIVGHCSYEGRAEALILARSGRIALPDIPMERDAARESFKQLALSPDEEIAEGANLALATFT